MSVKNTNIIPPQQKQSCTLKSREAKTGGALALKKGVGTVIDTVKNTNIIPQQQKQVYTSKSRESKRRGTLDLKKDVNTRSKNKSKQQPLRRSTRHNTHNDDNFGETEFSEIIL